MNPKRYDEFSEGIISSTDIILTANPNTGELKKVTLQQAFDAIAEYANPFDIMITFVVAATFSFNCPYDLVITNQYSLNDLATLDPILNTEMSQFDVQQVTVTEANCIVLHGHYL